MKTNDMACHRQGLIEGMRERRVGEEAGEAGAGEEKAGKGAVAGLVDALKALLPLFKVDDGPRGGQIYEGILGLCEQPYRTPSANLLL